MLRLGSRHARRSSPRGRLAILGVLAFVLAAGCTSTTSAPPETSGAEGSALAAPGASSTDAPVETPGATGEPSASQVPTALVIGRASPCGSVDVGTVSELIGQAPAEQNTWSPGDHPFGDDLPASPNFGCQYIGARNSSGMASEFGVVIPGEELTPDEWVVRSSDLDGCRDLTAPPAIVGDLVKARVCASVVSGWSQVALSGLFGGTGVICATLVPSGSIDAAYEASVIDECARILLEVAT